MKTENNQVRAARRLAPGGLLVATLGAIVLTASAIGAERTASADIERPGVHGAGPYDDAVAASQDTASLAALLQRVSGSNVVVCKLVNRALENRWGGIAPTDILEPNDADTALFNWATSVVPGPELLQPLRRALHSNDACVRRTAAQLLGHSRAENLADVLREELASPDAQTRVAALRAIGYRGHHSGLSAATSSLNNGSDDVRVTAIWVLGRIENHDVIPTLTELLAKDASPRVRRAAAWALGRIAG